MDLNFSISPSLHNRLKNLLSKADKKATKPKPLLLYKKNFLELLQSTENTDTTFYNLVKDYERKFANNAFHLKDVVFENLLNGKLKGKAFNNLMNFLIKDKRLFGNEFKFLFVENFRDIVHSYLKTLDENILVAAFKSFTIVDSSFCKTLAKDLLNNFNLEDIEAIIRKAYGNDVMSLSDALSNFEFESMDKTPYPIRQNLQSLLVELYREGMSTGREEFNILTDKFLQVGDSREREKLANLLKEKYPSYALEFFQQLAMDENLDLQFPDIRLHAIKEYASLNPINVEQTLLNIIEQSTDDEFRGSVLNILASLSDYDNDKLIKKLNEDTTLLTTLIKQSKDKLESLCSSFSLRFSDFINQIFTRVNNFGETVGNLKKQFQDDYEKSSIKHILANINLRNLINALFESNQIQRDNSEHLLDAIDDNRLISFFQQPYSKENRNSVSRLRSALKTQAV
jgi:hypothetical protein